MIDKARCVKAFTEQNIYHKFAIGIEASILSAAYNSLYHCEWYTPAGHDCSVEEYHELLAIASRLRTMGYDVLFFDLAPNDCFENRRIKLIISWEDAQDGII